jgi:hypothetical protein
MPEAMRSRSATSRIGTPASGQQGRVHHLLLAVTALLLFTLSRIRSRAALR